MPNKLPRTPVLFRSVFTKLLVISLGLWLLILAAVVATFFLSRTGSDSPFLQNVTSYLRYIVSDLGTPPSRDRAVAIARRSALDITFIGNGERWTTSRKFPDISRLRLRSMDDDGRLFSGRSFGHHYIQLRTDSGIFLFDFGLRGRDDERSAMLHMLLFVLLSLILLLGYLAIKRVLRPIRWLQAGVDEVADGSLGYVVPVQSTDELGRLAASFNTMTERLRVMMAAREHLLRDVSHELRSPLTRMRVALAICKDPQTAVDVQEDIEELETMITSILDAAKSRHPLIDQQHGTCDLSRILERVAKKYSSVPPGVRFTAQAPLACHGNEPALTTCFRNLVDNGLKFSAEQDRPVEIAMEKREGEICITVTDHGVGIGAADLPLVFEPFFRVDGSRSRRTGGFGLGLSLCRSIVEAHGGRIEIESTTGSGTTVRVYLLLPGSLNEQARYT